MIKSITMQALAEKAEVAVLFIKESSQSTFQGMSLYINKNNETYTLELDDGRILFEINTDESFFVKDTSLFYCNNALAVELEAYQYTKITL